LNDVRFRLSEGWVGLVGANGAGKSTLARLISGALRPSVGRIWVEPVGARVTVCEQEIEQLSVDLIQFSRQSDRESCRWRGLLGLAGNSLERWSTLSPGERKRWQIAAALSAQAEVLIVDEPTNHLDADARTLIINALRRFSGVGLVVSHDRELLRDVTTQTLRIHQEQVELYPASYSEARELWTSAAKRAEQLREHWRERQRRLEKRIAILAQEKQAAHRNRSARARMKNRHDHDASSIMADGRAANGEASISRRLGIISAELERTTSSFADFVVDKTLGRSLFLDYQPAAKQRILGLDGENLQVGKQVLLRDVRVTLGRDARVHLKGPNGCGKSTLLTALLARAGSSRGRLLWLPQEMGSREIQDLCDSVNSLPRLERGRLMTLLATLGVDPEYLMASSSPSPGEARKLKLAFGLATHAVALILDEPTNHLDLPSMEHLERALQSFPGAILLVSHDEQFAQACTTSTWEIRGQRVFT
jgi:ATPase subunit of ABC transporter with duplicated ATPase domains